MFRMMLFFPSFPLGARICNFFFCDEKNERSFFFSLPKCHPQTLWKKKIPKSTARQSRSNVSKYTKELIAKTARELRLYWLLLFPAKNWRLSDCKVQHVSFAVMVRWHLPSATQLPRGYIFFYAFRFYFLALELWFPVISRIVCVCQFLIMWLFFLIDQSYDKIAVFWFKIKF